MNVLGIDTSNQPMSVAVFKDNILAAEIMVNVKRNHSIQLMPAVEDLMKQSGLQPQDLDVIAVAEGPGSFTGIRIGMTSAKTLAWTLNIPIKTVSSLKVLAAQLIYHQGYICPFFDARRGNVYTGLYYVNRGEIKAIEEDCNIAMDSWLSQLEKINEPIFFTSSSGGENFYPLIQDTLGDQAIIINHSINYPRAGVLISVSRNEASSDIHSVKPNYLRVTQAEANLEKQQEKGSPNE